MIISRTPFRVSLFGGGSDYPAWYLNQGGGSVMGFAINKYCYINLRRRPPFFAHKHRIIYTRIENVNDITEIEHPAVRAVLSEMQVQKGIEIHHDADLPARSGLGSSSAFTVGLLNAMNALRGRMVTKDYLGLEAIRIEQDVIKESVGSQDQIWASHGGMNRINFRSDGSIEVMPIIISADRRRQLTDHMMLVFTGFSRYADQIASKKIANLGKKEQQIRAMLAMVDEAVDILTDNDRPITEIGTLLHDSWMLKRGLADVVTSPEIDAIYDAAREAGAIGGKLLGAGGGGFMLFFVEPHRQAAVRERLNTLIHVGIDVDTVGSRIVVYEPDGLEHA
ncbi:MAG: kinase [Rhodospirillaceae bacterium]